MNSQKFTIITPNSIKMERILSHTLHDKEIIFIARMLGSRNVIVGSIQLVINYPEALNKYMTFLKRKHKEDYELIINRHKEILELID